MKPESDYASFFRALTGVEPYPYQRRVVAGPWPEIVDVPTGLGKTAAVVVAWLHRRLQSDRDTPRRLAYCLPMRTLVEQTARSATRWVEASRELFQDAGLEPPRVYLQMGGARDDEWTEKPESSAIIVGTQDVLLSAALLRGYGVPRARWPVPFALLHTDTLWVFDEVQLMGCGRRTSAQLEGLRRSFGTPRPSKTLWLSATLDEQWLATADFATHLAGVRRLSLGDEDRADPDVKRRLDAPKQLVQAGARLDCETAKREAASYIADLASEVLDAHRAGTRTLVFVNSVGRAQALYLELERRSLEPDLVLVHARFRPQDRLDAEQRLLAAPRGAGTIGVATQALEAGVDVSAATLFTELAPWSSLVQRFGRANRYGEVEGARVFWIDVSSEEKLPLPYRAAELDEARDRLRTLNSASPSALPPTRGAHEPSLVLRRRDLLDLFDSSSDLSGFDIDVSPYVRDADDLDVAVFWRSFSGTPSQDEPAPERSELCRVSLSQLDAYAKRIRSQDGKIFARDPLDGRWLPLDRRARPGETLMLDAALGGYDPRLGFGPSLRTRVEPIPPVEAGQPAEDYDADWRSRQVHPVALERHLIDVEDEARVLCDALEVEVERESVVRAARWHDVGKSHPIFQRTLKSCTAAASIPEALAKSPCSGRHERPRFRHELASMLSWINQHDGEPDADLVAYLIAAHHGKVRLGVRSLPGEAQPDDGKRFARGVWDGDHVPGLQIGDRETVRSAVLSLDVVELGGGASGRSWAERTQTLLERYGPFHLAWLEMLVRVADWRASAREQELGDEGVNLLTTIGQSDAA